MTLLGGGAGAGASVLGMVSGGFSSVVFTGLAVVVSAAGAIVVGFPILVSVLLPTEQLLLLSLLITSSCNQIRIGIK